MPPKMQARQDAPPPTNHILRPHHVQLLRILMLTFKTYEDESLPPPFLLHVYRVVLSEIAEVTQPRTYKELYVEFHRAPMIEMPVPKKWLADFERAPRLLRSPEQFASFFQSLPYLYLDRDDDDPSSFSRRSIFGYFCRRCFVSFVKLSTTAIVRLHQDYLSWAIQYRPSEKAVPDSYAFDYPVWKGSLTNEYQLFKTKSDKKQYAIPDAFALWEKGQAVGDEQVAAENLHRFFEQHFHEGNDSGLRHLALLNLARMHYLHDEHVACRKYLQEAVGVARTCNDRVALQHCMSLLHRLPPLEHDRKAFLNDVQQGLHPFEVLFDVKKLLRIENQQPLSASFEKIVQATGLYDHWVDVQGGTFVESEQWAQHAVQSVVWGRAGCNQISEIEENVVTAFSEAGGDDNNRLVVSLNRAYSRARQGKYQDALAMLLEPEVWRGITLHDYNIWAHEIWHILTLRASRRGQARQFSGFLQPKKPIGKYRPRAYWSDTNVPMTPLIRDPLFEFMKMREVDQAHACVDQLLTAVWHAEFQQRFNLYRTAITMLADVGLEFGMTKWCRRIIDEIMPQIITGADLEQRALACFTLARCIIAAGDSPVESLRECLSYLVIAEEDYAKIEILRSLQDVQYLLSIVYHNLDMTTERDAAASRHLKTVEERKEAAVVVVEDWVVNVWEVVAEVGAALVAR